MGRRYACVSQSGNRERAGDITIINTTTGQIIRELILNPDKDYQPINPKNTKPEPQNEGSGYCDVPRHHMVGVTGFEPAASSSRTMRATKLRHTPIGPKAVGESSPSAGKKCNRYRRAVSVSKVTSGRHATRYGA